MCKPTVPMEAVDAHELSRHLRGLSELQAQLDQFIGSFSFRGEKPSPVMKDSQCYDYDEVTSPDAKQASILSFPSPAVGAPNSNATINSSNASSIRSVQDDLQRQCVDIMQDFVEIENDVSELSREMSVRETSEKYVSYCDPITSSNDGKDQEQRNRLMNKNTFPDLPKANDLLPASRHADCREAEVKKLKRTVRVLEDMVLDVATPQAVINQVLELQNRNKKLERELFEANGKITRARVLKGRQPSSSPRQNCLQIDDLLKKINALETENKKLKRLKSVQGCSIGESTLAKEVVNTGTSNESTHTNRKNLESGQLGDVSCAKDAPLESANGSSNLENRVSTVQTSDRVAQWKEAKRTIQRMETLKQKLDSKISEMHAANERIKRLENLTNKLKTDCTKKDAAVLELRRKVQLLESQKVHLMVNSSQKGVSDKLETSLLEHLRTLQMKYDELKARVDAAAPAESCEEGTYINFTDLGIDRTTQLQLERDQARSWASKLEKIIEEATRQEGALRISKSEWPATSMREQKLLNTISMLKAAFSKYRSGMQNGVSNCKYMKAIEKSKAAALRVAELEREIGELTEIKHRYSSAQQEVIQSQSLLSSLRSQMQQLKKQIRGKDDTTQEVWSGKVKELERALLEKDIRIASLEHPASEEARILLEQGITPKLLVQQLIRSRAELAMYKPAQGTGYTCDCTYSSCIKK
jgi:hypothetical protein